MNGYCDFCPRPGRFAKAMCEHEHLVGVWVCAEKHDDFLEGEIACRICQCDVDARLQHWCTLHEVTITKVTS